MKSYKKSRLKLKFELLCMFPFVLLGRIYGKYRQLRFPVDIFFFFPNADIGGSPKVNLDIVDCIKKDKKCLIIFSKKPKNNLFAERFKALGVPIIDLHSKIDNKLFHFVNFFYRGVIASWIEAQGSATVMGGECIFLYKIVPHLSKRIKKIELIHLSTWINYSIAFAPYLDIRLFSTMHLMREVKNVYLKAGVPVDYEDRFRFMDNSIEIPTNEVINNEILQVIFVGRGAPQKRPELIARIARILFEENVGVHFSFVGDVELVFNTDDYPFCTFYGNINDEQRLKQIYEKADVLMLTSEFEGLPIVVMQMMAYGKIVVSTAVGGIPDYIKDGENGYLITAMEDNKIIEEGVAIIKKVISNKETTRAMGIFNKEKAVELFGKNTFCRNIKGLLIGS
ncbi:glycosyltransferase [Arachidicoccus ginsenosidivorans]|uniref:Glycosyltransferase family 4 protein n=2 Tax=Arachidicoccus ginsenosidivorans TaxID=496057 RepID=A0A5B8VJ22_9BACT|nr:glycosyltransferase family 4 protein [Arachidicoccus ginsenosidivorans]